MIGEASLFNREQSFSTHGIESSIYHLYEAKRLTEKAPAVGKKTQLYVIEPDRLIRRMRSLTALEKYFEAFSPRPTSIEPNSVLSDLILIERKSFPNQVALQDPEATILDLKSPPPSPESPEGSGEI